LSPEKEMWPTVISPGAEVEVEFRAVEKRHSQKVQH